MKRLLNEVERKTIALIFENGLRVSVRHMHEDEVLTHAQVVQYLEDKEVFEAEFEGVTLEELGAFKNAEGAILCSAITKQGLPCKNYVHGAYPENYGPSLRSVREWLNKQGEYCVFHDGGHDVARR